MSENREALDRIAAFLIEKETITGKEFMKIFREVKGIPEPEEGQGEKVQSERIVMKPVDEKKTAEDTESADFGNNGGEGRREGRGKSGRSDCLTEPV